MDIRPPSPFRATYLCALYRYLAILLLGVAVEMPGNPLTKQRTSKCLRRCTQRFHLFMVSLQDWPRMIRNEQPSSICFFLWSTFPCLWRTPYVHLTRAQWLLSSDFGACERGPHPWTRVPCPHPKGTGLQQRWGKRTTGKLDCKSLAALRRTRECCAEVLAAGYLNTVYIVSFCLGLIDSLLTCFGFWLYTLFSSMNALVGVFHEQTYQLSSKARKGRTWKLQSISSSSVQTFTAYYILPSLIMNVVISHVS